jgi:hypothetical protein
VIVFYGIIIPYFYTHYNTKYCIFTKISHVYNINSVIY